MRRKADRTTRPSSGPVQGAQTTSETDPGKSFAEVSSPTGASLRWASDAAVQRCALGSHCAQSQCDGSDATSRCSTCSPGDVFHKRVRFMIFMLSIAPRFSEDPHKRSQFFLSTVSAGDSRDLIGRCGRGNVYVRDRNHRHAEHHGVALSEFLHRKNFRYCSRPPATVPCRRSALRFGCSVQLSQQRFDL
jgi:hypothetical protein